MKKIIPLLFFLSIISGPVLAWGWGGDGNCPYSKDKVDKENTEQVEQSEK